MKTPRVTVGIPAYNAAPFIERCVRSALASTERNIEVVVLDDASTDDTVAIAESCADRRVRVVRHERNVGRVENVKRALEAGTAPVVALLPADCALTPESLARRLAALDATPAATFAFGAAELCDADDHTIGHRDFGSEPAVADVLEVPGPFLPSNRVFLSTCLVRRKSYEQVDGIRIDVAPSHRDWDLMLRLGLAGPVAYVPEVVAVERVHAGNVTEQLLRDDRIVTAELLVLEACRGWAARHAPERRPILDDAARRWARRRIAHALLAIAGYTPSDPGRALGCALAMDPSLRRSPMYLGALAAAALPERVVTPVLRPALAPFDRRRRRRWNLDPS
jgi:glycosyltransferase involved in cell wall biosynthesis